MKIFAVIVVFMCLSNVHCLKILGVFPMAAHSHFTIGFRLMKELADRGHEVTFINAFPQKKPIANLTDVWVDNLAPQLQSIKDMFFGIDSMSFFETIALYYKIGNIISNCTFSATQVQHLLKSNAKFDVIVLEEFLAPALMGLKHIYNVPIVYVHAMTSNCWNNDLFGNPAPLSYVPNFMTKFSQKMSFFERLQNAVFDIYDILYRHLIFYPKQNEILHNYIPEAPDLTELLYSSSLILLNSHVSVNDPVPHLPNMIEIGGYHVQSSKELPKELKQFLDSATNGVVYFSMGSNLKSSDISPEKRKHILKVFSKLKQKVLWKFEGDELPGLPPNVKIDKWLPQSDVLAHPNIAVFISHGGLLSTIEALYHGVPIIGIPVFADQKMNIASAVSRGYAVSIPFNEITEESLMKALNEILNDPKYRQNARNRSQIMRDRLVSPMDEAVYWIEYVVRHQGAKHFRSAALDLTWYQRSMLDIIIVLTIVTVILFVIFYIIIKRIINPPKTRAVRSKRD